MKYLEKKILTEGKVLQGGILKVDGFLNHQMDVAILRDLGQEIYNHYNNCEVDKVLTVEASGIGIACFAAQFFNCNVLVAKKQKSLNISNDVYSCEARSFTKKNTNSLIVSKEYLHSGEKVLIVDDFLASGEACLALANIVEQAGATVVGISCAIEKTDQGGYDRLVNKGYNVYSLARIAHMSDDGTITFID